MEEEKKRDLLIIGLFIEEVLKFGRRKLSPPEEKEILTLTNTFVRDAEEGFDRLKQYLTGTGQEPISEFGSWVVVAFDRVVYQFNVAPRVEALKMIQFKTLPELKELSGKHKLRVLAWSLGAYFAAIEYAIASPKFRKFIENFKEGYYGDKCLGKIIYYNEIIHKHLKEGGIDNKKLKIVKQRLKQIAKRTDLSNEQVELILKISKIISGTPTL